MLPFVYFSQHLHVTELGQITGKPSSEAKIVSDCQLC